MAGIDLAHKANNYGIVSQISTKTGKVFAGNMFIVDSGNTLGSDNPSSGDFDRPFSTLDYAVGRCTANNGDLIILMPGHAETLTSASQVDLDVAGISVVGLGNGSDRPTFTYTVAAGEISIGADNVYLSNIVCTSSVTAVLIAIDIEDGVSNVTISNCEFNVDATGTDEFNATIHLTNNNTSCIIEDCVIDMGIGGAARGIHLDADTSKTIIRNNVIRGDYSTANIAGDTTLSTDLLIQGNLLENGIGGNLNAQPCIELLTGTTGTIADNYCLCNVATAAASIVGDTTLRFENYYTETISTGTGIIIGTPG